MFKTIILNNCPNLPEKCLRGRPQYSACWNLWKLWSFDSLFMEEPQKYKEEVSFQQAADSKLTNDNQQYFKTILTTSYMTMWKRCASSVFIYANKHTNNWGTEKDNTKYLSLHKKWSSPLRIPSVNVTKSLIENFIFLKCINQSTRKTI